MKRSFLENLGLEKDVIDQIMKEHGTGIETEKANTKAAREQLEEANKKIKEFSDMDIDSIKKTSKEWQEKAESFEKEIEKQKYNYAARDFLGNYKFSSELAKDAVMSKFTENGFKLVDGKFQGAEEFMKELMEKQPGAFIVENPEPGGTGSKGGFPKNNKNPKPNKPSIGEMLGKERKESISSGKENPYF